jgi:hypothetical protein
VRRAGEDRRRDESACGGARRFYEALGGHVAGEHHIEVEDTRQPSTVYGWTPADVTALLRQLQ